MQKSVSACWPNQYLHQVYLCKSVLEESVQYAPCVVAVQLQHEALIVINISTTMLVNHTLASFPRRALKFPKTIVHWSRLTFRRASLVPSMNFWKCALQFRTYTCIKHRERSNDFRLNVYTVYPIGIHSLTQLSSWGLTSISTPALLTPACCHQAGVELFPLIVQQS